MLMHFRVQTAALVWCAGHNTGKFKRRLLPVGWGVKHSLRPSLVMLIVRGLGEKPRTASPDLAPDPRHQLAALLLVLIG